MTTAVANLTEADIAALEALIEPWRNACLQRDWDTILGMCTDDVTFLPPGSPPVSGEKLRTFLEAFPVMTAFTFKYDRVEGQDNFATLQGPLDMTVETDAGEVRGFGKFVDVMRKGADGTWRFSCVIWNDDAA